MLVNMGEVETDAVLREVADKLGVRVFAKPRLADVLDIDRSGLSPTEFTYALKAHLDFVIAEPEGGKPHFAVEFDGPYHATSKDAQRRDEMKNAICERLGLPLLRIDADYLRTVKGFRLVAWLVELWFLDDAFYEAQKRGEIPWDEPFGACSVVEHDAQGRWRFPYDLAAEARRELWRAHAEGRVRSFTPNHVFRSRDDFGAAYALIRVGDEKWLISHVRISAFRFPPVSPGELAADLALVELAEKLEKYERGVGVAAGREHFEAVANLRLPVGSGWSFAWGSD
jgi:ADP-ribose pyrophosphatase YjhB (NUDIX family)